MNTSALHIFLSSFSIAFHKPLRIFVWLPLLVNVIILSSATYWLISWIGDFNPLSNFDTDVWYGFVIKVAQSAIKFLMYVLILPMLIYGFMFLAAIIVSPFSGLLAEKTAIYIIDHDPDYNFSFGDIVRITMQALVREFQKLMYFIPRALGILILGFIPVINIATPFLWIMFAVWMAALQFLDYAADNEQIPFNQMRILLNEQRGKTFMFGFIVWASMMIPILNFILIPVVVIAATRYWFAHYQPIN